MGCCGREGKLACMNKTLDESLFTGQCISHYRPFHVKLIVLTVEYSFARYYTPYRNKTAYVH